MFVRRTTYNAMKRRLEMEIASLKFELDQKDTAIDLAVSSVNDTNEDLARKLAVTRLALIEVASSKPKRSNKTIDSMVETAEKALEDTQE